MANGFRFIFYIFLSYLFFLGFSLSLFFFHFEILFDCPGHHPSGPKWCIRFAVFALGSSAYPNFCAFGRYLDTMLAELGGERITKLGTGDELCGQEQSFYEWSAEVFEQACEVFCLTDELDMGVVLRLAAQKPLQWCKENVLLECKPNDEDETEGIYEHEYTNYHDDTKHIQKGNSILFPRKFVANSIFSFIHSFIICYFTIIWLFLPMSL